jgi:hypothetical protein
MWRRGCRSRSGSRASRLGLREPRSFGQIPPVLRDFELLGASATAVLGLISRPVTRVLAASRDRHSGPGPHREARTTHYALRYALLHDPNWRGRTKGAEPRLFLTPVALGNPVLRTLGELVSSAFQLAGHAVAAGTLQDGVAFTREVEAGLLRSLLLAVAQAAVVIIFPRSPSR